MNFLSAVRGFGRKLNLQRINAAFDGVVASVGGGEQLARIFREKRAHSLSQQAQVVDHLAGGTPVGSITVKSSKASWFNHSDLVAIKSKLGQKRMLALMRRDRAHHVFDQAVVGARELLAEGTAIAGVDLKMIAGQKTGRESRLENYRAREMESAAPTVKLASKPSPAAQSGPFKNLAKPAASKVAQVASSKSGATLPAAPPAKAAASQTAQAPSGALTLEMARARTMQVFGAVPAVMPGESERLQWQHLTDLYQKSGHACPWDDSTEPAASTMGILRADHAWRAQERRIAEHFPGAKATTGKLPEKPKQVVGELRGRERYLATVKIRS